MISEVSICNQALTWLAASQISSLSDNTPEARWMNANYENLRDAVIQERQWSFATARHQSESQEQSDWGTSYVHKIPDDWLAVFRSYSNVNSSLQREWVPSAGFLVESDGVHTHEEVAYLYGVKRIINVQAFPVMFVQALAARLAADAAIPLTENVKLQADMWSLYQVKLDEAAAKDGQQGARERIRRGVFTSTRGRSRAS